MELNGRISGKGKQHCQCQCHPDLSWMKFGDRRIHVTDVDCMFVVERHGKFLFIEWKETHEELTIGQRILAEQLSLFTDFTVVIMRGTKGEPETIQHVVKGRLCPEVRVDRFTVQDRLDVWFLKAEGKHVRENL